MLQGWVIIVFGLLALNQLPGELVQIRQLVVDLRYQVRSLLYCDRWNRILIVNGRLSQRRLPLPAGRLPFLMATVSL
jgi:hypothetical protein